jgi:hypothetical protein
MSTETFLVGFRWFLLSGIAVNLLQATVLFEWFQRAVVGRFAAFAARRGQPLPAFFVDRRVQRVAPLFNAAFFFAFWWFLGTPAGVALFSSSAVAP